MGKIKTIKYAIEQEVTLPVHYTDEDVEESIKNFAKNRNYIWCEEDEELFDYDEC